MTKKKEIRGNKIKVGKFVYWAPRILSILFIIFLAMFSLDIFDSCTGFLDCAIGLFMHNIPSLILLVVLLVAWKREWVGAAAFIFAGVLYTLMILINLPSNGFELYMITYPFIIAGPAIFIGILFYLNWKARKKIK
ncbi:MAG: hypothetical protein WC781_00555 [Candidatus Pacearchaeota archaeon]|jgi:hypothetical protein